MTQGKSTGGQRAPDRSWDDERGIALVSAMLLMVLMSGLAASGLYIATTETMTASNYRTLVQARYAAEGCAQRIAVWFENSYPAPSAYGSFDTSTLPVQSGGGAVVLSAMPGVSGNYPDATVQAAYSAAFLDLPVTGMAGTTCSSTATLRSMNASTPTQPSQTWQIRSRGSVIGVRPAAVEVVLTVGRTVSSGGLPYAIYTTAPECGVITMSGDGFTDSYDSSAGTYAATQQYTGGDVWTNGNLELSGSATVWGTLSSPHAGEGSCSAGGMTALSDGGGGADVKTALDGTTALSDSVGGVFGGLLHVPGPGSPTIPPAPDPAPPTTDFNIPTDPYVLAPGTYGNLNSSGGETIVVSAGTYNINSLSLISGSSIEVTSGPVVFNVAGVGQVTPISASGGTVTNLTGLASNLVFNYGGKGEVAMSSSGTAAYEVINTPNAAVAISGGGDIYGQIIGRTVELSDGSSVHFDRSLASGGTSAANQFRPLALSWDKY